MILNNKIQQIFNEIGRSVHNSSLLGKGEASTVFKVDTNQGTYALKTALYPERRKKILNEAQIRTFFIDKGLSFIPQPIYSDNEIFTNGAVIYEYVKGSKLDFINLDNLKQIAQIISEIHSIDYEIMEDGSKQIQQLYDSLRKTITRIATKYPHLMNSSIELAFENSLKEYEQKLTERNVVTVGINAQLHGDLSDNFILNGNGKIWLIDWENSEFGDIADELFWFLFVNEIESKERSLFFKEYQKHFKPANNINFEELAEFYYSLIPVFNICWGLDQLDMNLKQNLEPKRKLRDLAISAMNWKRFFSDSTATQMIKGIRKLNLIIQQNK